MPSIKIRVGASLDAGALTIYQPLEKAAEKARKNIDRSLNEASKGTKKLERQAKSDADKLEHELESMANEMLRAEEKALDKRTKLALREAKKRVQAEKAAAREIAKAAAEAGRAVSEGMHLAEGRGFGRGFARFLSQRGGAIGIGRRAAISVSRGGALAYGLGGRALSMAGDFAADYLHGLGLETSIGAHAAKAQDLTYQAQAITSAGYIRGASGAQGIQQDPKVILGELQAVGNATATSFNEVGDALRQFVAKTGDLETGRGIMMDLSKLAKATNTDLVDMAEASAEVSNHLGNIPDKAGAINAVMRVIAGQGKLGALEIKDFAAQMAKVAANAGKFEGGAQRNIGELGLLAQESKLRGGSASATQAATSVAAFARDFAKGTTLKHWTAAGLSPYTDKTKSTLRSPEELVAEALNYSKGDLTKLAQLFPNAMSMRAVQGFSAIYTEAGGTHEDKLRAVHEEFERLRHATLTQAEITRAFGEAMDTGKSRIQLANNRLQEMAGKINEAALPALAALAPAIEALIVPAAGLAKTLAKFLGIDTAADDEAKKKRRNTETLGAARAELEAALQQQPKLVKGEHGATFQAPTIDKSHVGVVESYRDELAGNIAVAAGKVEQDKKAYEEAKASEAALGAADETGAGAQVTRDAKAKLDADTANLNEMKVQQNKTNQILSDIHTALISGRVVFAAPTPPVRADHSGTADSDSDSDHP